MSSARQWGPSSADAFGLVLDGAGHAYAAGETSAAFAGETHAGSIDSFASRWTFAGDTRTLEWTRQFGTDMGERGHAVALGSDGAVYVSGATFGTFPGFKSAGDADLYLARIAP